MPLVETTDLLKHTIVILFKDRLIVTAKPFCNLNTPVYFCVFLTALD